MKRHSSLVAMVLTVLSLFAVARPAAAGDQAPFRGRLEGVVTITPDVPPFMLVLVEAEGKANHLGRFSLTIPHRVNRDSRTAEGSYHFVAANGDTLTADFTGQSFLTDTPGVLRIVEIATITGGTGRFEGATGGFVCERLFDTASGETTGSFDGTITPPGAVH